MSLLLSKQVEYQETFQAYQVLYEILKCVLGPEHPSTLTTRNNMAGVLSK